MILKLPVVIDCRVADGLKSSAKILFHNFSVEKNNNELILDLINPYNKVDYIKLPCSNNLNCLFYLKVSLPLKFTLFDNKLFSNYFFYIATQSKINNELDFFHNFVTEYKNKTKKNLSFFNLNDIKNQKDVIFNYINNFKLEKNYNNVYDFLNNYFNYVNLNINLGLMINYFYPNFTNKIIKSDINKNNKISNKKISLTSNIIKNIKFKYKMSSEYTLNEHLKNFDNKNNINYKNLVNDNYYFIEKSDNSNLRVKVNLSKNKMLLINGNNIDVNKYNFSIYPKNFDSFLNKNDLFSYFVCRDFHKYFVENYFKDINLSKIFDFFNDNFIVKEKLIIINNLDLDLEFEEIEDEFKFLKNKNYELLLLSNENIDSVIFKQKLNTLNNSFDMKIKFLEILFKKYTFPIEYNKRKLDSIFEKILYFSFINCNDIFAKNGERIYVKSEISDIIPSKLKNLYNNLLKLYYNYINNDSMNDLVYNFKLYNDYIHYEVLKTIIESDSILNKLFRFNKDKYLNFENLFRKIGLLSIISRRLKWRNLSKKLSYLKILFKNKNLLFFQDKLNKSILPENFDSRLKKIILNPCEMFKYLKKESDFIKWVYFLNDEVQKFYNVSISVSDSDYIPIGKIIYLLTKIDVQDLGNKNYCNFLKYCKKKHRLILYNSRINIRIKELFKFLDVNINLGFLAKHLTWFDNTKIKLTDSSERNTELEIVYKKYYKYKGKYLKLKKDTSSIEYTTSINSKVNTNIEI